MPELGVTSVQEKIKGYLGKVAGWWKAAGKKVKLFLIAGLIAVVAVVAVVLAMQMNQPYTTLFTGLNQTELNEIVSYLSEQGMADYRIEGSDTILVPAEQEVRLKAALAQQGYPKSGFAYSMYLDHVGSLTTEGERKQLELYELQDRIAAVVRCFDGVQEAVVDITPGEDNTFILDSENKYDASAAVFVTMRDGAELTQKQVQGIRNFVSHSVQGLKIDNVTITDSYGNTYSAGDTFTDIQDLSTLKLQLEEQINNKIRTSVLQVLTPIYGTENVKVSVNSIVDLDRSYTDSTDYNLEDWANDGSTGGEGIIGEKIYEGDILLPGGDTAGGVPGTSTNADLNQYVNEDGEADGEGQIVHVSGDKKYLVDETNQQVEHLSGTVSDVMVSVTINQAAADGTDAAALYPHVARAAGIATADQRDKISVLISPFYQADEPVLPVPEGIPAWVIYAAAGGGVLFLVLLLVILLLGRRRRKRRKELEAAGLAAVAQTETAPLTPQEGADIMNLQTEKSMELRKDVRKFAEDNPEIAAQMVKSWLREGDGE
ncbi:MAG: flagellar M-ring protein FliF [Clostridiales bacterium]|nr:flagellar basal-body MS-ring/collar protein FliF [Flavonifractor plautii]MBS6800280.1 flagellar M-ring protein FliF [Clostridiales bacterium]